MQNAYYLTDKDSSSTDPNTNGNGGWSTCYHSSRDPGDQFNITCNTNSQTPITRVFSIAARTIAIELREVEIYGYGENLNSNLAMYIFTAIN